MQSLLPQVSSQLQYHTNRVRHDLLQPNSRWAGDTSIDFLFWLADCTRLFVIVWLPVGRWVFVKSSLQLLYPLKSFKLEVLNLLLVIVCIEEFCCFYYSVSGEEKWRFLIPPSFVQKILQVCRQATRVWSDSYIYFLVPMALFVLYFVYEEVWLNAM